MKRIIADTVSSWNVRIQDLIAAKKKEDKMGSSLSKAPRSLVSNSSNVSLDVDKLTIETAHSTDLAARLATRSHDHHQSVSDAQQVSPNASREDSTRGGGGGGDPDTRDASHSSSLSSSPSNNRSPFQRFRSSSDVLNVAPSPAGHSLSYSSQHLLRHSLRMTRHSLRMTRHSLRMTRHSLSTGQIEM